MITPQTADWSKWDGGGSAEGKKGKSYLHNSGKDLKAIYKVYTTMQHTDENAAKTHFPLVQET